MKPIMTTKQMPETRYEGSELEALGMAVDIERMLAEKTLTLMNIASDKTHGVPDGEVNL